MLRAAVAIVLIGCAGSQAGKKVGGVRVNGNRAFSDGTITSRLATRPPHGFLFWKTKETFDPIALELDRKRVEAFYHEQGYFSAHVTNVDAKDAGGGKVDVTIDVEEGDPTHIASIDVDQPGLDRIVKTGGLKEGERFVHPDYLAAKQRILAELVKRGYAHAEVSGEVDVDRDSRQAVVKLHVDPGPLVHFGKVRVEGLKRIPESAILNRVAWRENDRFDPELISVTQARLYQLGYFSVVRIDYDKVGRPETSDVTIHVGESSRHELRAGLGVLVDRSRWEVHARAGWSVKGFIDPLTDLHLDLSPGYTLVQGPSNTQGPTLQATLSLTRQDFIFSRLTGTALGAYDVEPREGYTITGPRTGLTLDRAFFLHDKLKLHAGWVLRNVSFLNVDPADFGPNATAPWVGWYEQQAILDLRDNPRSARYGAYFLLHLEEGGPFAGGNLSYTKVEPEARGYIPIGSRIVAAIRARIGRIFTFGSGESPVTQRFFEGGPDGHRGFSFRRLSPQVTDPMTGALVPIGGDEEYLGSFELRLKLFTIASRWFSIVPFVDAGDVTAAGQMNLLDPHIASGLGLRYDTIVGPVRFDLGFRLNRMGDGNPDPNTRFAFAISLGEAF